MKNKFYLAISLCLLCGINVYGSSVESEYLKTIVSCIKNVNQNQNLVKENYMTKMLSPYKKQFEYLVTTSGMGGLGDRLNIMAQLIHYEIAFNRDFFTDQNYTHVNGGYENFFSELPNNKVGQINITYSYGFKSPTLQDKVLYVDWLHSNEHIDEIYKLLDIGKKKNEVLKKYNIPKDYFDNTMSLHIRCGDTKKGRVEKYEYYYNAVKYINGKTGANKVICFYENDDFSTNTASEIINKLKKDFPKLKFMKSIPVETDGEELLVMSMCKHNIQSHSYFTKWATNFNLNPKKVIFRTDATDLSPSPDIIYSYNGKGFCDYNFQRIINYVASIWKKN